MVLEASVKGDPCRKTQIPVPRNRSRLGSDSESTLWRTKYEDSEAKRKETLTSYLRALRERDDLEKVVAKIKFEHAELKDELEIQKKETNKLRTLSEGMVREYDQLKTKYEMETGHLQQAMKTATEWYKQNRQLKRKSAVLMQRVLKVAPQTLTEMEDETDQGSEADEVEALRNTIQELRNQVTTLQAEVNGLKLQEFEAQEEVAELTSSLEQEKEMRIKLQSQLEEIKLQNENFDQVTRLAAQEVSSLRDQYEKEKTTSMKFKTDADHAKRERNIMAHQSQILLSEAASDEKLLKALMEIENLKRSLEEQQQIHAEEVATLQEKLDSQNNESKIELLEEKLKLVESELAVSLHRAERAELEAKKNKVSESVPPPPPPPPLPCLTPASTNYPVKKTSSVVEMANLLGLPRAANPKLQQGAIDEIINELKGGRFTLKTPEKVKVKVADEEPPALKEMMNILGTLRKRAGNRVPSFKRNREFSCASNTGDIKI